MTVYRQGATEVITHTAFLETNYKTNAAVTRQVTGVDEETEVQTITVSSITDSVYYLTVGEDILETAALGEDPDIDTLVAEIQDATGYGDVDYTVAAGVGDTLVLTWKAAGAVTDIAELTKDGHSAGTTTLYRAGATGVKKAQRIPVTTLGNYAYTLVVDDVTLTTAAIGSSPSITTLANALKNDADYATAPFTITPVYEDTLFIEWKTAGVQADSAVLTADGVVVGTTVVTTAGADEATEIQEVTPVLDAQSIYRLTVGDTVLTTAAMDGTPVIAELNTLLQADDDYAGADFTTSVSGAKILLTWKAAGAVEDLGEFDYREYIEGPYSTAIPSGVAAVRVVNTAACNLKIGADAEAGASDMYIPAATVEVFKVSPGDRVSFKGTASLYVTHLYQ